MLTSAPEANSASLTRLIVAVHGIGDQFKYATIQSAALQIAKFCRTPMPFPLGEFHPLKEGETRALPFEAPAEFQPFFGGLGFAEVFWADLHQEAQKTGDTIEESKAWAQTMIERMKSFDVAGAAASGAVPPSASVDYAKASAVVAEMIETIQVLENLCLVAEKAGLPKFQLRALLDDYLGAVQLVTEFEDYRGRICGRFSELMRTLVEENSALEEIHIVAHSEGTVVSFYGLLAALAAAGGPDEKWVKLVRGFMTIGSPIDKHIVMWPRMWKQFHETNGRVQMGRPIIWWNYYDRGDPVGFELDTARAWLIDHSWVEADPAREKADGTQVPVAREKQPFFDFPEEQDVGFTRYPLPGAAHTGYWTDPGVFGHFISNVMAANFPKKSGIPKSRPIARIVSWVLPYIICFLILCGGTYILYKNLHPLLNSTVAKAATLPAGPAPSSVSNYEDTLWGTAGTVLGMAALLAGITVTSRIPRLVRFGWWHLVYVAAFGIGALAYWVWVAPSVQTHLGNCFLAANPSPGIVPTSAEKWVVILVAAAIGIISAPISKWKPKWGMKPLMTLGGCATIWLVFWIIQHGNGQTLWPLVLSTAAFLYLWWIAALIFDLVFVWHRYIRGNETSRILQTIRRKRRQAAGELISRA